MARALGAIVTPNLIGTRTATSSNRNLSGMDHTSTSKRNYDISLKANLRQHGLRDLRQLGDR